MKVKVVTSRSTALQKIGGKSKSVEVTPRWIISGSENKISQEREIEIDGIKENTLFED